MRSYKQIRADIVKLEREAAAVKKSESTAIVARIRKLAEEYGLTAADIGLGAAPPAARPPVKAAAGKKAASKTVRGKKTRSGAGVAKYRDPKSGKTWTGFGRAPDWLATAKNRDVFLIAAAGDARAATAAAAPRAPSKAARKGTNAAAAKTAGGTTASRKAAPARKSAGQPAAKKRAGAKTAAAGAVSEAPNGSGNGERPPEATPS